MLPFTAGAHRVMYGMFHMLRFPAAELPDVIYGENLTSAFYLDKPADVAAYTEALDRLCAQASLADKTATILRRIRKDYQ